MLGQFITKIKGAGLARPNKYSVTLFPPAGLGMAPRDLAMMAESVSMPGQNIRAGTDVLRHGPQREVAQGFTYGPISINFICTEGMPEKKFFEDWQEFTVNKTTWEPKFYKDYVGRIHVKALNVMDQPTYTVKIFEAYPKTVSAQEFSYGATGSYQTISVEITYRYWTSDIETVANITPKIPMRGRSPHGGMKWTNPGGNPSPSLNVADRHPPAIDEVGVNTTPAVPDPADASFLPSPGQPVAQTPARAGPGGVGDGHSRK